MRYVYALILATMCGCGSVGTDLFGNDAGSGRGGAGGKSDVSSSSSSGGSAPTSSGAGGAAMSSAQSSSVASASAASSSASSSSGGGFYWASGVQQNVPAASLSGWTECFRDLYADNMTTMAQALGACPGSKLALACRTVGSNVLQLIAMGERADVTFMFPLADNTSTHEANGVGWYMSGNSWGFAPAGDAVWKGPMDVVGISPNSPGPDGDKRLSWLGNIGSFWVGYRCGYEWDQSPPGFDYKYERVIFSAP